MEKHKTWAILCDDLKIITEGQNGDGNLNVSHVMCIRKYV